MVTPFVQLWVRQAGLILALGLSAACNTPPSNILIPNDDNPYNKSYPGASATGAKFIFDADGHCQDERKMELMVIEALKEKGACKNGFVMGTPRYSPPTCSVGVHCK
jgi:hypothetical protein